MTQKPPPHDWLAALLREDEPPAFLREKARERLFFALAKKSDSAAARAIQRTLDPQASPLPADDFQWLLGHAGQLLRLAASLGKTKCVQELLRHADPRAPSSKGATALMQAVKSQTLDTLRLLLPLSEPDAAHEDGRTALMIAAEIGFLDGLRLLLPHSAAHAADHEGRTALMAAAAFGRESAVEFLLPFSDLSSRDRDGRDALFFAAEGDHVGVVRCLVRHGAPLSEHPSGVDAAGIAAELRQWRTVNELAPLLSLARLRSLVASLAGSAPELVPALVARVERADLRDELALTDSAAKPAGFRPSRL